MNLKVVADCPSKVSNYVVYSDASDTGCGAHLNVNGEQVCYKKWGKDECGKSSTWRELSAILFALHSFLPLLKGSYVKWFSDSQNACKVILVGSMRSDLVSLWRFSSLALIMASSWKFSGSLDHRFACLLFSLVELRNTGRLSLKVNIERGHWPELILDRKLWALAIMSLVSESCFVFIARI